jgi:endonuclease III
VPRESKAALRARVGEILGALRLAYPDAHCELDFATPFQLTAATILSAQCTDARVNMVTPELFRRWPDAHALAGATQEEVEAVIRSTGFFRNKAKSLLGLARALVADHGGEVPRTMTELRPLPGIGRKTANCVLGNAYGLSEGITVDTHVLRLSKLLGFSKEQDAEKLERDLMEIIPREDWAMVSHLLIWHGRRVCIANRPKCGECTIAEFCPSRQDR